MYYVISISFFTSATSITSGSKGKVLYNWFFVVGELPQLHISYKPQKISPKSTGIVRQLLHEKIRDAYIHPQVR